MSVISDSIDALRTRIVADIGTGYQALPNEYALAANPETFLDQGYAIQLGQGENSDREISCTVSIKRAIAVVLTRKFIATHLNRDKKEEMAKLLLEDANLIIKDFSKEPSLGVTFTGYFGYVGDSGIQSVFTEKSHFIYISLNFELETFENVP